MRMWSWCKQTRGHAFLQGVVKQNGENCYSFSGTLKRVNGQTRPTRMTDPYGPPTTSCSPQAN